MRNSHSLISRTCTAVLLLLLTIGAVQAQNVTIKGDVITVDKKPYAKLLKSGGMIKDFTLTTLDDKEVMTAKGAITQLPNNETFIYYTCTFKPGGETAELSKEGFNFAQQLATALVSKEVMLDGQPNPAGIAKFVGTYSEKLSAKFAKEKSDQLNAKPLEYATVQRPRSGPAQIVFNRLTQHTEIRQGNAVIGYFGPVSKPKGIATCDILLPDGMVVASLDIDAWMADNAGARDMTYKMLVKKNNQYHNRSAVGGVDAVQKDAVDYLVTGGYL